MFAPKGRPTSMSATGKRDVRLECIFARRAIDHDVSDPMAITGLSMAAQAQPVTDPTEVAKAMNLLVTRYPEYAAFPMPKSEEIAVYRVLPKVISILDYSKGFGHSDLVSL